MNLQFKLLVISIICLSISQDSVYALPPVATPPSVNYVPVAAEFSPHFSGEVTQISAAIQEKDKERLKTIATELSAREELSTNRGDEDEKFFLSAYAKRNGGDLEGAVEDFRKSIEYRQSNPHVHFLLARTLADLAKCSEAFSELDQVKFILGSEPAAGYLLRAQCLASLNRQPEADTIVSAAKKAFPTDNQIKKLSLNFKARAMSQGAILDVTQTAELEGDLPDLATANPEDSNIQLLYAKSLLKKGDILTKSAELDSAEKIARAQVEKFQFKNETSVKLLFDVLLKKRRNAEAQEVLTKAKEVLPDSKVLADSQRQLEIETKGLKVLKYDRR